MKKRTHLKINTIKELYLQLGLPAAFLLDISSHLENNCWKFNKSDKKGKERILYVSNKKLGLIHKKINILLDKISYPINIQGGVMGRSTKSNAIMHTGKKYVANYDIKNFFPSIGHKSIYRAFLKSKCTPDVSRLLTRLTSINDCLPQGFATSPKISCLVLFNVNERLTNLFKPNHLSHSFWIDDLTISGNKPIKNYNRLLDKIFIQEGFQLHNDPNKRKIANWRERQTCTGLVINQELNVEKSVRKKLRKELFICKKFGVKNYLDQNGIQLDEKIYLASLKGRINYLCSINPKNKMLKDAFDDLV
jgi:hypothetical protein